MKLTRLGTCVLSLSFLVLGLTAFGCSSSDEPASGDGSAGSANSSNGSGQAGKGSGAGNGDGSGNGSDPGAGYCNGTGPLIPLARGGKVIRKTCTGDVAEQTFTSALCSCEDTNIAGYLRTDSFQSSLGPDAPVKRGGPVGVNASYITAGYADIGGSFAVAGARDILFGGLLKSGGDLRFAPHFDVAGVVEVARDAHLAKNARAFGVVDIGRDLYTPAGVGFVGVPIVDIGGERHVTAVSVPPPCACRDDEVLDVAAIVEDGMQDNDNAAVGLDPKAMNVVAGIGVELALPCGRYYVDQIGGLGSLTLRIQGRTALFVGDDVWAGGLFKIELDPGAELDLFIRDNFTIAGAAKFGDEDRPAAVRIYVGGTGDIAIAGYGNFAGNVYAPRANITIAGLGVVHGSLFGKNINSPGAVFVHYDESVLEVGDECPVDPPEDQPCTQCGVCGNGTACVDGSCGACRTDADCCAPLVCQANGKCGQIVPIE